MECCVWMMTHQRYHQEGYLIDLVPFFSIHQPSKTIKSGSIVLFRNTNWKMTFIILKRQILQKKIVLTWKGREFHVDLIFAIGVYRPYMLHKSQFHQIVVFEPLDFRNILSCNFLPIFSFAVLKWNFAVVFCNMTYIL